MLNWIKEGVNYWENPDCPKEYLEGALVRLVHDVEGEDLPLEYFADKDREYLVEQIERYEYVADK